MNRPRAAVITGASSGIGRETAKLLAAQNYSLVLIARNQENLHSLKHELSAYEQKIIIVSGDLTRKETLAKIEKACKNDLGGKVNALLNIAGINHMGTVEETTLEKAEQVFQVNYFAVLALTRIMLPFLRQAEKPVILNVSSIAGQTGVPGRSVYSASKAALEALSQSLRLELHDQKVDVKVFRPAAVLTNFHDNTRSDAYSRRSDISPRSAEQSARELVSLLHSKKYASAPGFKNYVYQKIARHIPALSEWGLLRRYRKHQVP